MKKHFNLFSLFFLAASMIAFAQSSITGTVSDADGSPLPGATVVVQGTSSGVTLILMVITLLMHHLAMYYPLVMLVIKL